MDNSIKDDPEFKGIEVCYECRKAAVCLHKHHVVPKSLGGTQTVPLCPECHGKVHGVSMASVDLVKEGVRRSIARHNRWAGRELLDRDEILRLHNKKLSSREIAKILGAEKSGGSIRKIIRQLKK